MVLLLLFGDASLQAAGAEFCRLFSNFSGSTFPEFDATLAVSAGDLFSARLAELCLGGTSFAKAGLSGTSFEGVESNGVVGLVLVGVVFKGVVGDNFVAFSLLGVVLEGGVVLGLFGKSFRHATDSGVASACAAAVASLVSSCGQRKVGSRGTATVSGRLHWVLARSFPSSVSWRSVMTVCCTNGRSPLSEESP